MQEILTGEYERCSLWSDFFVYMRRQNITPLEADFQQFRIRITLYSRLVEMGLILVSKMNGLKSLFSTDDNKRNIPEEDLKPSQPRYTQHVRNLLSSSDKGTVFYREGYLDHLQNMSEPQSLEDSVKGILAYLDRVHLPLELRSFTPEKNILTKYLNITFLWTDHEYNTKNITDFVVLRTRAYLYYTFGRPPIYTVGECKVDIGARGGEGKAIRDAMEQVAFACDTGLNGHTSADQRTTCFVTLVLGEYIAFF